MDNRNLVVPHQHSEEYVRRYFDELMRLTHKNPELMANLVYAVGAGSLALTAAFPGLGRAIGVVGLFGAGASYVAQHKLFGFPVKSGQQFYQEREMVHGGAIANITLEDDHMPKLTIKADNHYDAGYVEGSILAEQMKDMRDHVSLLYPAIRLLTGAPQVNHELEEYLSPIIKFIPKIYQDEMRGKVDGYNKWMSTHHPEDEKLTFERYVFLQMLPDFHNYCPFPEKSILRNIADELAHQMGCSTIALRLGDITCEIRNLDWYSHNVAGKYNLQVDRDIKGASRTVDIGSPLISGALTALNQDGLLVEINVSCGDKIKDPQGMPAILFNRFILENAESLDDVRKYAKEHQPVGPYHMTATHKGNVLSVHWRQSKDTPGEDVFEELSRDKSEPQLMVVTNHGVKHASGKPVVTNRGDSTQRKNNVYHLFNRFKQDGTFDKFMAKQGNADMRELQELMLEMARLPLVDNCRTVLCAFYIYHHDQLIHASAASDNGYAPDRELDEFQQLSVPGFSK